MIHVSQNIALISDNGNKVLWNVVHFVHPKCAKFHPMTTWPCPSILKHLKNVLSVNRSIQSHCLPWPDILVLPILHIFVPWNSITSWTFTKMAKFLQHQCLLIDTSSNWTDKKEDKLLHQAQWILKPAATMSTPMDDADDYARPHFWRF